MKFSELMTIRQSVRAYQDKPVEDEKIGQLIEAVRLSPSACNSQPWRLVIVNDPVLKRAVAKSAYSTLVSFNKFVDLAPVIVVFTIERPKIITQIGARLKDREFPLIDIGIAAENFCLQAAELGLGTCMLGWFDEDPIKMVLHIPQKIRLGLLITLGYAAEAYPLRKKKRKNITEMCSFNRY
ncbi:MAG: NAD(P)H nitroreductase [Deltaproteobacteria bacterium RIFOXYD12_FULL_55_16]|nr:MAG: NAD(P)H nitroreductase [Deltaproteobacteria bacterium RIFOXYD12_FULL_55_16]